MTALAEVGYVARPPADWYAIEKTKRASNRDPDYEAKLAEAKAAFDGPTEPQPGGNVLRRDGTRRHMRGRNQCGCGQIKAARAAACKLCTANRPCEGTCGGVVGPKGIGGKCASCYQRSFNSKRRSRRAAGSTAA